MNETAAESRIAFLEQALAEQKRDSEQQKQHNQALMSQLLTMQQRLDELLRILYGQRSEKKRNTSTSNGNGSNNKNLSNAKSNNGQNSNHPGRRTLPKDLPRTIVEHKLTADECFCPDCDGKLKQISTMVSEQLDIIPAKIFVIEHHRYKYACQNRCGVRTAPMPVQPIDKGLAASGLLAYLAIAKYQDHMPLYRFALYLKRHGINIAESTLCDWVAAIAELLSPLVNRMREQMVSQSSHLFTDDTPIPVLMSNKTRQARLWVYIAANRNSGAGKTVIYEYTPNRQSSHPQKFLSEFNGYLQADAYPGYDKLYASDQVIEVGCMAHARRKFVDIVKSVKGETAASEVVDMIGQLYGVEKACKTMTPVERYYYRRRHGRPILKVLKKWLMMQQTKVTPKGPLGKAIAYALNHWQALNNYLRDGRLLIDNNTAERAIKPVVMGRKNYLFAGSHEGGKRAAIIYSIIETCKLNQVNTFEYLKWVLEKIPRHPNKQIDELLPYNLPPDFNHWP